MAITPLSKPFLNIQAIQDQYLRKNFENLKSYFDTQNQLLDFAMFEQVFTKAQTGVQIAHDLPSPPLDIIVTMITGSGSVTFQRGKFTANIMVLDASGPCRIRFFAGTHWRTPGSVNVQPTDVSIFTASNANSAAGGSTSSEEILNLGLSAKVTGTVLTVALTQADGASPPAGSTGAVKIGFRSVTATVGGYNERSVTSALSISTPASGATFGLTSGQNQFIYVYALDNNGTVELALSGSRLFDEGSLISTSSLGASSTNALVLYSASGRPTVPVRLIGRILMNQSVAGVYSNAPIEIALIPLNTHAVTKSEIHIDTFNSTTTQFGTVNTGVFRFTTTSINRGTAFIHTTDAASGSAITLQEEGIYVATGGYLTDGSAGFAYITQNATTLTFNTAQANDGVVANAEFGSQGATRLGIPVSGPIVGKVGDVIRLHGAGSTDQAGATSRSFLRIVKVSN